MASQTQGIQQLLAAEKRAAEKVAEARKRKARRLKQAKEEAQDEIEKYRQERERQFKEFENKHMGSKEDVAARIEADTKIKIDEMQKAVNLHKEAYGYSFWTGDAEDGGSMLPRAGSSSVYMA